jgi:hypothetical protein
VSEVELPKAGYPTMNWLLLAAESIWIILFSGIFKEGMIIRGWGWDDGELYTFASTPGSGLLFLRP